MNAVPVRREAGRRLSEGCTLIAVASGKGGVGKTWFSITLAHALAQDGLRSLLFDADLGLADVDSQLGLTPPRDLAGAIAGRGGLGRAVTHVAGAGFDVIAGHSGAGCLPGLARDRLRAFADDLAALARGYDRVILHLGAGIEETARTLSSPAGLCLVLTTDEPAALTDAYAFIKLVAHDRPRADLRIVVNQVPSPALGERAYAILLKACENFLGLSPPLAGVIRRDRRVGESIRVQTPLLTRFPLSEAAADVATIARRLVAAA